MYLTPVMHLQCIVIDLYISMERPSQTANTACFAFLDKKVDHAVVYIALTELLHSATANHVQQVVIDVIHLHVFE